MATKTKQNTTTLFTTVVAGIKKHITGKVTVGGVTSSPVTLAAPFVAALQAIQTADAQHTEWSDDVKAMNEAVATAYAAYKALKQFAIGQFGAGDTTVLTDLGVTAPKTTKTSAATKAVAAIKAKATRAARGTTSKKQKQSVKGSVQVAITAVPVVTTPAAPAEPATVANAAPAAAPATGSGK
jgi:hypothetical protein